MTFTIPLPLLYGCAGWWIGVGSILILAWFVNGRRRRK